MHYWYEAMNKFVSSLGVSQKDQQKLPVVLGKVALDQLVFSPPFNLLYFHAIGLLEGTPSAVVQEKIAATFVPLMSQCSTWHSHIGQRQRFLVHKLTSSGFSVILVLVCSVSTHARTCIVRDVRAPLCRSTCSFCFAVYLARDSSANWKVRTYCYAAHMLDLTRYGVERNPGPVIVSLELSQCTELNFDPQHSLRV